MLEASVELYYKNNKNPLLMFDESVYFGEISYLLKTRNFYKYRIHEPEQNKKFRIYSINNHHLDDILEAFPDFKSILRIRALRR